MVKKMFRLKDLKTGRIVAYVEDHEHGKRLATINQMEHFELMPCLIREVENVDDLLPSNGE